MKKFLLGLVAGILLAGLAALIFLFTLLRVGERRPDIAADSTLVFTLEGEVPEEPPFQIPLPWFQAQAPVTVHEVWDLLRKASVDSRIKAIVFEPKNVQTGWGKLQEIRDNLLRFKKSGKPLIAFLRTPGAREYYLATAADSIYLAREDYLDLKGLRAELIFVRKTLDKLGIEFEVESAGKYKDAADMFTRTSMRPETREVMDSLLDHIYGHLLDAIATSRKKRVEEVRAALDEGPFLAAKAFEKGLVDALLFEDEVYQRLEKRLGQQKIRKVSHRDYVRVPAVSLGLEGGSRIALIVGEGTILRGGGEDPFTEEAAIRSRTFIRRLRQVAADDRIRGVVLRVNSPGGDAIASDEILREVRLLRDKKPMVISMSDLAASGGYFISMTGDPIVAYPNTFTGSIGVIYGKVNLRGLYEKLGVEKQILTRGRFADIDSDYRLLSDAARRKLRQGVLSVYQSFLERVAEGRRKKVEEVEPYAQGRVWLGVQAQRHNLVDELGGLDRAIELVKQKAGIPASEKIRLVTFPRKRSLLDVLFGRSEDSLLEARLRALAGGLDLRPLWPGGILKLMPYEIVVR